MYISLKSTVNVKYKVYLLTALTCMGNYLKNYLKQLTKITIPVNFFLKNSKNSSVCTPDHVVNPLPPLKTGF
jgi:hypothetical protein